MKNFALCLAVAVVVSGCVTPVGRYESLQEKTSKAQTLQEAVKSYQPNKIEIGQEIDVDLDKSDDILLADGYLSYYKVFSFEVAAGRGYTLNVTSSCDCLGFQKLAAVPVAYVVDSKGKLVSGVLQPVHQAREELNGGLVGEWGFTSDKNDQYYLVLAANNSSPGKTVGTLINARGGTIRSGLQASTTGSMVFKIDYFH